ncbi:MAG: efflux RND transporter periplasmic adaptor subunit [bacterium]
MSCCNNFRITRKIWLFLLVFLIGAFVFSFFSGCSKKPETEHREPQTEILYWTCGMHPSIKVSPEEYKKGSTQCPICKMDLVPVKPEKESAKETKGETHIVRISHREIELAGITTIEVAYRHLSKEIAAVGKIAYDPDMVVAEEEYLTTLETYEKVLKSHIPESVKRTERLLEESKYKLKLLGLNDSLIEELKKTHKAHTNLILPEKTAWVYADVYEFDIGVVKEGQEVKVEATAYPGKIFTGKIRSIDSVLNPRTRSSRVRAEIPNPGLKLKPDMFVKVKIMSHIGNVLSVPRDAILDTGRRKLAYVDLGDGQYAMREVEVGIEGIVRINNISRRFYPVTKGLKKGEKVVSKANFLIDSQSQLTGPAASAYGGALDEEEEKKPAHQH